MLGFIVGLVGGFVFAFVALWNRTMRLEDELEEKEVLLNTAVEMLRDERNQKKEWKEVEKTCGTGDLFGKW